MLKSGPMDEIIEVEGLVKRYGPLKAIDNISLTVHPGEIFGIIGPNGAGKTTTLEIIEGLRQADKGHIRVLGLDVTTASNEVNERIGVQLQASAYFDYLTLTEILELFGSLYKRRLSAKALLDKVGLETKATTVLKNLSGGQKQRFTVAASLVNDPDLIILDEPTTGLDPAARRSLWKLIRQFHAQGKTIVITTHYMEEAQYLCDRVAIMDRGKIVAVAPIPHLIRALDAPCQVTLTTSKPLYLPQEKLAQLNAAEISNDDANTVQFYVKDPHQFLPQLLAWAEEQPVRVNNIEVAPATLEDVFLKLTGHRLGD